MSQPPFDRLARVYDLLYGDKDYSGEARAVDSLLRSGGDPAGSLLDVGCGTGLHAEQFARLGWEVAGIDLSDAMIARARERVSSDLKCVFSVGAAAQFDLGRKFDAAVSLFHVASYQTGPDDLFNMLANIRRHLADGALLVFDFWHGPGVLADPPAVRVKRVKDGSLHVTRLSEPSCHPEACLVDIDFEFLVEDGSGRLERFNERHHVRYFFLPELELVLRRAGFVIVRTCDGISEKEIGSRSWYGLIVAKASP